MLVAIALSLAAPAMAHACTVTFNDPDLESAVRAALQKPTGDITDADMRTLNGGLWIGWKNIDDLTGLEYATNLKYLYAYYNQIPSLAPVAGLTQLEELYVGYNQISDMSPVANLHALTELNLTGNQITDLSPAAGLTNLRILAMGNNLISDLTPVADPYGCPSQELWVQDNRLDATPGSSDMTVITNLQAHKTVNYWSQKTCTITPSAGAHGSISPNTAQACYYGSSKTFTMAPDAGYHVADVLVDGVSVGAVNQYTFTDISANHTISVSFSDVVVVTFNDPDLETAVRAALQKPTGDITDADMRTLNDGLWIGMKNIDDLTGLEYATNLKYLFAYYNQISSIAPVAGLTQLEKLYVGYNQISDMSPVANLHALTELNLTGNQITDLSPAAGLTNLRILAMGNNLISDLTPVADPYGCPSQELWVQDNRLDATPGSSDMTVITNLQAHKTVNYWSQKTCTITPSAGAHGSISPNTAQACYYGSSKTFTMAPDAGYHVADVLVDGVSVGAVSQYTFTDISANHTISVSFSANGG